MRVASWGRCRAAARAACRGRRTPRPWSGEHRDRRACRGSRRPRSRSPFASVSRRLVGGDDDDGDRVGPLGFLEKRGRLETVELRHLEVEQDERKVLVCGDLHRLDAGARTDQALAERLEDRLERHQVRRMIVDQQDVRRRRRSGGATTSTRSRSARGLGFFGDSRHVNADTNIVRCGGGRVNAVHRPTARGHAGVIVRRRSSSERDMIARSAAAADRSLLRVRGHPTSHVEP